MSEPCDDWGNECNISPEVEGRDPKLYMEQEDDRPASQSGSHEDCKNDSSPFEDDEEVTESKIRAFLDEKVLYNKNAKTKLYKTWSLITNW